MKSVYLVRHCDYDNPMNIIPGRLPLPLSNQGKKQAEKLALYFEGKKIQKVYSSAVQRCKETAQIISQGKIPVVFDKRLLESITAYQGYSFGNKPLDWKEFHKHRDELGGESYVDIWNRAESFLHEIVQKDEGNIVICSHGDELFIMYLILSKKPVPDLEILDLEDVLDSKDYQPRSSVRELIVEGVRVIRAKQIITQKDLKIFSKLGYD